jgi:raffinose/stachyose/melibiose transport system permease protein
MTSTAVTPDYLRIAQADRRRRLLSKYALAIAFAAPGLLLFTLFVIMPISQSFIYSQYDWNGFTALQESEFVGIGNFERLLNHKPFHAAISHTVILIALSLSVQLPLALGLALLVGRGSLPGRRLFRMMLFVPYVFSEIITAIIWRYVFDPTNGLLNVATRTIIPSASPVAWLAEPNLVMVAVFMVLTWKYFGFYMILYMAALQNISGDLEDAARIDGATEGQVLRFITLPLLGPTIRLTIYLSVIGSIQQFVVVWVMTQGGPLDWSETLGTYVYKFGISRNRLGYGSAVAVVLFTITLFFSLAYQNFILRRDYADTREGRV